MKEYNEEDLRLLTELLPNVGGAMRSPMANLYIAVTRMLPVEKREKDPELDQNAALFRHSFHRMNRLVVNLTDAADLAGGSEFNLRNTDVVVLTQKLCVEAEALFDLKGVTLEFVSDRTSCIIALDEYRYTRMLLNLLSNALKFTPSGGSVTVRMRRMTRWVRLSVSDTGCGIAAEKLETVFARYLDTEDFSIPPQGLGLGLALCRATAKGHGGTIVAESEEGKGSCFTVSLPNSRNKEYALREPPRTDPLGGFNRMLTELSDALPAAAYAWKYGD